MTTKKRPDVGVRAQAIGDTINAVILTFPGVVSTRCASCKIPFKRKFNESWKRLCAQCYFGHRVYLHIRAARRLIKAVRR